MIQLVGIAIDRSIARIVQFDEEGNYTLRTLERDDKPRRPRHSQVAPIETDRIESEQGTVAGAESGYFQGVAVKRLHPWGNDPDRRFCGQIVSAVAGADRVALFGTDDMMSALDAEFRRRPAFLMKLVGVEPFEGKTPAMLVEAVRQYYHLPNPNGLTGAEGSGVRRSRLSKSA